MKQKLIELKERIDKSIIIFGTLYFSLNRTNRKKTQEVDELKHTINQVDLLDIEHLTQ
jgi:preprotein translocase subunit YajC